MGDEFVNMFERPYRPLADMSLDELRAELERWRNIWTWIESDYQFWLTRIGTRVRFTRRDYKTVEGTLGAIHFNLKEIEVEVVERVYDYARGEATYEDKTVVLPISAIYNYEFLHKEEVLPETISGETRKAGEPVLE